MILNTNLLELSRQRRKDMEREAENERLINSVRQAQREYREQVVRETRNETRRNSTPLWARIWSLL